MNVENRIKIEKQIVRKIIKDALAAGYLITVSDGEDYVVSKSSHGPTIFAAMFTTDEDVLIFRNAESGSKMVGHVYLVYGNDGYDVICDYTANDATEAVLAGALALAGQIEAKVS